MCLEAARSLAFAEDFIIDKVTGKKKKKNDGGRGGFLTKQGNQTFREMSDILDIAGRLQPEFSKLEQTRLESSGQTLADLYSEIFGPLSRSENALALSAQSEADLADVQKYGPQFIDALNESDPMRKELRSSLNQQVQDFIGSARDEFALGTKLSPEDRYRFEQEYASQASGRGFGYSPSDAAGASLGLFLEGQALRDRRQAQYGQALGLGQAELGIEFQTAPDPLLAIRGRPSNALAFGQNSQGQTFATAPPVDVWGDLFNVYKQDQYQEQAIDQANKNRKAQQQAAYIQAAGSIIGGATGAAGALI